MTKKSSEQTNEPISVFFSYGHDCEEIILRIQKDLTALGFNVWVDHQEIKEGNEWRERITSGILESDSVIAFLSRHSLRKDSVCLNELSIAVGCKFGYIKTVLLEPDIEYLIPASISGIQFCDMSKWRILKAADNTIFENWYQEKLHSIVELLSSKEVAEMNSQLKYLEQMLSPSMWQLRQQNVLQKQYIPRIELETQLRIWQQDEKGSRAFLVCGEPGSGKSTFMVNYHHFNYEAAAIAFCDWKRKSPDHISEIIRSIAFQLAVKIPSYRTALVWHIETRSISYQQLDNASLFESLLVKPMYGLIHSENEVYLVLIDSINELNENGANPLAEIIAEEGSQLPAAVRFVISSRVEAVVSSYFPGCSSYSITSASESTITAIRQFYALHLGEKLQAYTEPEADRLLDMLAAQSEGNFLFSDLCARAINDGRMVLDEVSAIPSDLNGIYYRWFVTLFPDDDIYLDQYYIPLSVLCAVDDPIPQELLQGIMEWNIVAFNKFIKPLKEFLKIQKNAFGKPTITLFHSSMKAWLLSEYAGVYMVDAEEGITAIKEQLLKRFENNTLSPYQCKILISVLEKTSDDVLRQRIYRSEFFFRQYYALARAYEHIRSGYHKAILIYTHLKEICQGLPTEENVLFLKTVYPVALSRCYCQIGDYHAVKPLLEDNLKELEACLERQELMEIYYILGSVYDWLGNRNESVNMFNKLYSLATEENDSAYILQSIVGLIWNDHFTNIDKAFQYLETVSLYNQLSPIECQLADLVRARILLSAGDLDKALNIYDKCLDSFDFSFRNDVCSYRKNRLMLLEILPACYDNNNYIKGVQTGKLIMNKLKNTGWLEECYCASWIALNYLGMGNVEEAGRYLKKAKAHLGATMDGQKSRWMDMHLTSIEAFLLVEKGEYADAVSMHIETAQKARICNDIWVEGDACFEISRLSLMYGLQTAQTTEQYISRLENLADSSQLAHLVLKAVLIRTLHTVMIGGQLNGRQLDAINDIDDRKPLASTNYIDVFCIKALIYKKLNQVSRLQDAVSRLCELVQRPENKNRYISRTIGVSLRREI